MLRRTAPTSGDSRSGQDTVASLRLQHSNAVDLNNQHINPH